MPDFSRFEDNTAKRLRQTQTNQTRLLHKLARMKDLERKKETRRKIQLGGLIKKAGIDSEATAILYGLLLEAAEQLESEKATEARKRWQLKGDIAFTQEALSDRDKN